MCRVLQQYGVKSELSFFGMTPLWNVMMELYPAESVTQIDTFRCFELPTVSIICVL
jgi:hypothetical protein